MSFFCCPMGDGAKTKLVEMSPFRDNNSDVDEPPAPASLADHAKGWLSKAAAPLQAYRESQAKAAERAEELSVLKAGAQMKLLPDGRGEPSSVRVALSSDGAMLTWSGGGSSGVMALSAVRDVKPILAQGFFKAGGPVPCQWMLVADDQTVRFEAATDEEKQRWMSTLEGCVAEQLEAKQGRKLGQQAKRQLGLEQKRREAERRKAEVLKTCNAGGMKHTGERARRTRVHTPRLRHGHFRVCGVPLAPPPARARDLTRRALRLSPLARLVRAAATATAMMNRA